MLLKKFILHQFFEWLHEKFLRWPRKETSSVCISSRYSFFLEKIWHYIAIFRSISITNKWWFSVSKNNPSFFKRYAMGFLLLYGKYTYGLLRPSIIVGFLPLVIDHNPGYKSKPGYIIECWAKLGQILLPRLWFITWVMIYNQG